jgi:hypothetical protein
MSQVYICRPTFSMYESNVKGHHYSVNTKQTFNVYINWFVSFNFSNLLVLPKH